MGSPPAGPNAALICLLIFGLVLPMTVGQRVMVGLRRTTTQVASQAVVAPFMLVCVGTVVLTGVPFGDYVSIFSYIANSLVSIICLVVAARILKPQLGRAIREIPKVKAVPGVRAMNLAWPMLVQMIALPIAMQTHRLLLSHLTDGDELAQYNLSAQLFGMVLQAIAAGGVALWPIYARARARRQIQSPFKPMLFFLGAGLLMAGVLGPDLRLDRRVRLRRQDRAAVLADRRLRGLRRRAGGQVPAGHVHDRRTGTAVPGLADPGHGAAQPRAVLVADRRARTGRSGDRLDHRRAALPGAAELALRAPGPATAGRGKSRRGRSGGRAPDRPRAGIEL